MEDLKNLKKLKGIDISEYNGTKTSIETVELQAEDEKDFGKGIVKTRQLLVKTKNLSDIEGQEIFASEYISLKHDKESNSWGFSDSKSGKPMKVLNFFKAESFDELVGKSVVVVLKVRTNDKEYLGINCGF